MLKYQAAIKYGKYEKEKRMNIVKEILKSNNPQYYIDGLKQLESIFSYSKNFKDLQCAKKLLTYNISKLKKTFKNDANLFDVDGKLENCRISASEKLDAIIQRRYSDRQSIFIASGIRIIFTTPNLYSPDFPNYSGELMLGVASWLLEQYKQNNKLEALCETLANNDSCINVDNMPSPISLIEYNSNIVVQILHAIRSRHNAEGNSSNFRVFFDEYNINTYNENKAGNIENTYDKIFSLISQQAIDKAVEHYKKVYYKILDAIIDCCDVYEKKINSDLASAKNMINATTQSNASMLAYSNAKSFEDNAPKLFNIWATYKKFQNLVQAIAGYNWTEDNDFDKKFGVKFVSQINSIDFGDPYELCFALLYLADQKDDLVWSYGPGGVIIEYIIQSLPYNIKPLEENSNTNSAKDSYAINYFLEGLHDRSYDLDMVHPHNASTTYNNKRSLAQLFFAVTGVCLPQSYYSQPYLEKIFHDNGIPDEKAKFLCILTSIVTTLKKTCYNNSNITTTKEKELEKAKDEYQLLVQSYNSLKKEQLLLLQQQRALKTENKGTIDRKKGQKAK